MAIDADPSVCAGSDDANGLLLELDHVTLQTPDGSSTLVQDLSVQVCRRRSLALPILHHITAKLSLDLFGNRSVILLETALFRKFWDPLLKAARHQHAMICHACDLLHTMCSRQKASMLMQVNAGQSLLVMGPSGVGKTSVLRAIAGLWSSGSGSITRCNPPLSYPSAPPSWFDPVYCDQPCQRRTLGCCRVEWPLHLVIHAIHAQITAQKCVMFWNGLLSCLCCVLFESQR